MHRCSVLLALLAVASLAACGGEEEPDASEGVEEPQDSGAGESAQGDATAPADYAEQVCSAIGGWYDDIASASTTLVDDANALADDPAAGKELVLGFLDDAITFTDDLVDDLVDAGAPDTEVGQETADELVTGIEDVSELFRDARDDTDALPADDPQALGAGLQEIGAALQESATAVGEKFEEVLSASDDEALAEAFDGSESCRDLATIG